jgi:hypothetical protein
VWDPVVVCVTLTEAVPEADRATEPSAVESTLNTTVPVGLGDNEEVTLTAKVTAVPEVTEVPVAGEVMVKVGAGSAPKPDN